MTKAQRAERQEAIEKLREWIKPGDTVYTILEHVSSSGMSRAIRCVILECEDGRAVDRHPNWAVGKALGLKHWKRNGREQDALVVGGCGMDMGFHLVYGLSSVLYGGRPCTVCGKYSHDNGPRLNDLCEHNQNEHGTACTGRIGGYRCLGKGKCPSNYHSNHHDTIQCEGTRVYNADGPDSGERCYWLRGVGWVIHSTEAEATSTDEGGYVRTCPTCKGTGRLPNPEGPERFDLIHTDGYSLRHRWL